MSTNNASDFLDVLKTASRAADRIRPRGHARVCHEFGSWWICIDRRGKARQYIQPVKLDSSQDVNQAIRELEAFLPRDTFRHRRAMAQRQPDELDKALTLLGIGDHWRAALSSRREVRS